MEDALRGFEDPPLTEVVIGVALKPLPLSAAHLGVLWSEEFAADYPNVEEQPLYSPPVERSDPKGGGVTIRLGMSDGPPVPRLWFVSGDNREVIQVQRDWFGCNWRKGPAGEAYDRWPAREASFVRAFGHLNSFLGRHFGVSASVAAAEVSYINHIRRSSVWDHHGELHRVLKVLVEPSALGMAAPEQVQFSAAYPLVADDATIGRLHVRANPANLLDGDPIFVLDLTARSFAMSDGLDEALAFLRRARESIVVNFKALTTDALHAVWRPE